MLDLHRLGLVSGRVHNSVLVARLGSIRQAAKAMNLTSPSISRTIRRLEDDLATPLFERAQQRLKLTSAGDLLYCHIRQSTGELNRAIAEIGDLQGVAARHCHRCHHRKCGAGPLARRAGGVLGPASGNHRRSARGGTG